MSCLVRFGEINGCQCCLLLCPDGCVHHYLNYITLNVFEHWTRAVFLGRAESFQLRIEIADKHDIVGRVVDSLKQTNV